MGTRTHSSIRLVNHHVSSQPPLTSPETIESSEKETSRWNWILLNPRMPSIYRVGTVSQETKREMVARVDNWLDCYYSDHPGKKRGYGRMIELDSISIISKGFIPSGSQLIRHRNDVGADMFSIGISVNRDSARLELGPQPDKVTGLYDLRVTMETQRKNQIVIRRSMEKVLEQLLGTMSI